MFEDSQFSFTNDGQHDDIYRHDETEARELALVLAGELLNGDGPESTSTHYIRYDSKANWQGHYTLDGRIGEHLFYTNETPWR